MSKPKAFPLTFQLIEAGPIEWGLLCNGLGVRTWWKSTLGPEPTLSHPEVKRAIQVHRRMRKARRKYDT